MFKKTVKYYQKYGIRLTLKRICKKLLNLHRMQGKQVPITFVKGQCIGILTAPHCLFIAGLFSKLLGEAGFSVKVYTHAPIHFPDIPFIVICPQYFMKLPKRCIVYQMEQTTSDKWMTEEYFSLLRNAAAVFDYSLRNIGYFEQHGIPMQQLYYMPLQYNEHEAVPADEPYLYDVLFYGDVKIGRRQKYLKHLSEKYHVKVISNTFGEELLQELSRAKIILNVHYFPEALLETTRIYECLSLGRSIVISEESIDIEEHASLRNIVDFVPQDDIEAMLQRIDFWLLDDEKRIQKLRKNKQQLQEATNWFRFYLYRFLTANDSMCFDEFYEATKDVSLHSKQICLSLAEAPQRRQSFLRDTPMSFELFPGLRHVIGWRGCGMSYKYLLKKALDQNMDMLTICEDDVFFGSDFMIRYEKIRAYLEQTEDWDVFSGLMADVHDVRLCGVSELDGEKLLSVSKMVSMVFNVYHASMFEQLIAWQGRAGSLEDNAIDRFLEKGKPLKVLTTIPFLVGHKEELGSTIWEDTMYGDIIEHSIQELKEKLEAYQRRRKLL